MDNLEEEELLLRSLDASISNEEKEKLAKLLLHNDELRNKSNQIGQLREMLRHQEQDSFGPFFAEQIAYRIGQLKKEVDYQIFFFFKRYQLLAAGIVIALLAINILLSDQLSIKSIFGLEEEAIEDVVAIDVLSSLTK
jgi:hypothetical protein